MQKVWISVLVAGMAMTVLSCQGSAQGQPGGTWQVVSIGEMQLTGADGVTLDLGPGEIRGSTGCNRYSGSARLGATSAASGSLELGPLISTRMACPGRGATVESRFLSALDAVSGYRIDAAGQLRLLDGDSPVIVARRR
jgi:heat shock protein HslJ